MCCRALTSGLVYGRISSNHSETRASTCRWTAHAAFPQRMTVSQVLGSSQRLELYVSDGF